MPCAIRNAVRYSFVATEGPVVLFDFHHCEHISNHLDLVNEVRSGKSWSYYGAGYRYTEIANNWAAEIADLVKQYGGGNSRLAIDRCNEEGIAALHQREVQTFNGEEVMEQQLRGQEAKQRDSSDEGDSPGPATKPELRSCSRHGLRADK